MLQSLRQQASSVDRTPSEHLGGAHWHVTVTASAGVGHREFESTPLIKVFDPAQAPSRLTNDNGPRGAACVPVAAGDAHHLPGQISQGGREGGTWRSQDIHPRLHLKQGEVPIFEFLFGASPPS